MDDLEELRAAIVVIENRNISDQAKAGLTRLFGDALDLHAGGVALPEYVLAMARRLNEKAAKGGRP